MILSDVFNQLLYGELSQTGLAKGGTFATADYPKIITLVNLGILELHKRFLLREREVIIQLYNNISRYHLHWDYAYTNATSTEAYKYIIDSPQYPFNAYKYLKILVAYDELGEDILLNPSYTEFAIEAEDVLVAYTPSQLELQIPYPNDEIALSIVCQVSPNDLTASALTSLTTTVDLPDVLLKPLLIFIAERYFRTMTGDKVENRIYPSKFEDACKEIESSNLINTPQISGVNKFWRNGWV